MLCDYHLHSEFSFDSSEKIENICRKAIEEEISEIRWISEDELNNFEFCPGDIELLKLGFEKI